MKYLVINFSHVDSDCRVFDDYFEAVNHCNSVISDNHCDWIINRLCVCRMDDNFFGQGTSQIVYIPATAMSLWATIDYVVRNVNKCCDSFIASHLTDNYNAEIASARKAYEAKEAQPKDEALKKEYDDLVTKLAKALCRDIIRKGINTRIEYNAFM